MHYRFNVLYTLALGELKKVSVKFKVAVENLLLLQFDNLQYIYTHLNTQQISSLVYVS